MQRTKNNPLVLVGLLDLAGTLIEIGQPALQISDLRSEDVLGRKFWDCYWWCHSSEVQSQLQDAHRAARSGEAVHYDVAVRVRDEELMWIDFQLSPILDDHGEVAHLVALGLDLTDRHRAQVALAKSEQHLQFALTAGRIGIWEVDLTTDTYTANEVDFELYGLPYSDKPLRLEDSIRRTYAEHERKRIREEIQHSIETGERLEQQKQVRLPDGSIRWLQVVSEPQYDQNGRPVARIGVTIDVTEQKLHEQHTQLLMGEINHRSKNLLAVVQSIARSTARTTPPETFAENLGRRLRSLSQSQDLLIKANWRTVDLRELVFSQLQHLTGETRGRIAVEGDPLAISPAANQAIGMAMHELTTNALKYGALSNDTGIVEISWQIVSIDGIATLKMAWRERKGPPVAQPDIIGFGHTVLDRMMTHALGGEVELLFASEGLGWHFQAPLSKITTSEI
jgi:PAS domain S-box-containing protein